MGGKYKLTKEQIIQVFPLLSKDSSFEITSQDTPNYNCIAWAYHYSDRWMQYDSKGQIHDGVFYWWPEGVPPEPTIKAYQKAFELKGYELCDNGSYEKEYIKIALYKDVEGNCTHAARQKRDGCWTSKLGSSNDISHASPYSIEGNNYGEVACFMKKKFY